MIKAVVICEDHQLDEYIIRPVIEQIFAEHGRKVRVTFAPRTLIQGVAQALQKSKHRDVFDRYGMANAFFLIVDRDCDPHRENGKFADRLAQAADSDKTMFGCLAIEELEVWALALHRRDANFDWDDVRSDCDPKEHYFEPFVQQQQWQTGPGKGRKSAMAILTSKWDGLKNSCPEVAELSKCIREWLDATGQD